MILVLQQNGKYSFFIRKEGTYSYPKATLKALVKDFQPSKYTKVGPVTSLAPHELCWWK